MLLDAWYIKNSSFVLTVLSDNERGNLVKMAKIISKYTNIASCLTLDVKLGELVRRNLFTLPVGVSNDTMKAIVDKLEKKGFVVAEIEDLQSGTILRSDEKPGQYLNK